MALRFTVLPSFQSRGLDVTLPSALTGPSLFVAGHLFLGCAQYAAGSKKVSLPALSDETFEMSGVHVIRTNHVGEAIESLSPPTLKGDRIEIRLKHPPARFYQIVDSFFD
jgi:hypothetical protein